MKALVDALSKMSEPTPNKWGWRCLYACLVGAAVAVVVQLWIWGW